MGNGLGRSERPARRGSRRIQGEVCLADADERFADGAAA